nr:MAG TPA: hypothetical protein [Caudoviricetes sp.]
MENRLKNLFLQLKITDLSKLLRHLVIKNMDTI